MSRQMPQRLRQRTHDIDGSNRPPPPFAQEHLGQTGVQDVVIHQERAAHARRSLFLKPGRDDTHAHGRESQNILTVR